MRVCVYICVCVCVCVCVCMCGCGYLDPDIHTHTYTHTHTLGYKPLETRTQYLQVTEVPGQNNIRAGVSQYWNAQMSDKKKNNGRYRSQSKKDREPDFSPDAEPFVLDTDASNVGMGGVLSQVQGGQERVIAFASQILSKSQRNYSTYDRELLAVVHFMQHFRCYLLGKPFLLRTDHQAIRSLQCTKEPSGRRARWLERLAEYQYTVMHRPGRIHGNADALSRLPSASSVDVVHVAVTLPSETDSQNLLLSLMPPFLGRLYQIFLFSLKSHSFLWLS